MIIQWTGWIDLPAKQVLLSPLSRWPNNSIISSLSEYKQRRCSSFESRSEEHHPGQNKSKESCRAIMPKTVIFTTITPLPSGITRQSVLEMYHDHLAMIDLNPLVVERFKCKPPSYAPTDEYWSTWYTIKGMKNFSPTKPIFGRLLTLARQSIISAWRLSARFSLLPRMLQRPSRWPAYTRIRTTRPRHSSKMECGWTIARRA